MPTYPQEPDRAAPDPVEPVPEGAGPPPRGDLPQPGPPRPEAANGEPGPDAAGPAPAEDEYTTAILELEDRWRRALADLDNLRKRHARELERERAVERSRTAAAFLPVLDNLELALSHAGADPGAIVEGIRAVRDQAVNVLELLGYPRHAETGVAFDPALHEVVGIVQDPDAAPGTVVEVLRAGYGDGERQLRPAAVTVAKRE
ncbi:molecular chaperone GrpE [Streptomyces sp. WM6373]|uniref:nucleotide exchange factor GrpE n=1 Tax=Streptomyces TaxID=1883 RepID=UPI0006AE20CF|nr:MULTISPECIES: nucleotide exchange factor GrpE [unclassified Streptomyces]KOU34362.1 molecular chaperone GrpE [Streptomyces sp. WM6373]KOU61391.1 molecular chaperone GrpE [Streptomyces sp. IGB124]KOU85051.1 molecular chaperone GrpE [Streptomyces sp. XY58]KOV05292.1 molecular chaperone GrpE [Streptomyces sp. XY37]KOV31640.1 molecular chaperone GrpE [Streptomyces sp. H021]